MQSGPKLTPIHMEAHVKWAKDYSYWRTRLLQIVFSDEKSLISTDWMDLLTTSMISVKRNDTFRSITRRWCCNYLGSDLLQWCSKLDIVTGKLDSDKYCYLLTKCFLPFASEECPANWIFQQVNTAIHGSSVEKSFYSTVTWTYCRGLYVLLI